MTLFLRRATGPILLLIAVSAVLSTIGYPGNSHWSISPVLFPSIVGGILLILSATQILKEIRAAPIRETSNPGVSVDLEKLGFVIVGYAVYTLLTLRFLPFDIGTMLFIAMVLGPVREWRFSAGNISFLVIFSFSLSLIFELVLRLPLPGKPSSILRLIEFVGN